MNGPGARGGGRGGGRSRRGGQAQEGGQGVRQRRRDGSGRGATLGPGSDADIVKGVAAGVTLPAPAADVPSSAPAIAARARTVAVVAHPDQCTLCEACLDACPPSAIALRETVEVDAALCTGCGACEDVCPNGVFELTEV